MRIPSLLAGCGLAICVFKICEELGDREVGKYAVLGLLILDGFVKSVVSARPYALALFLSSASILFFLRWMRTGGIAALVTSATALVLAFYCQYFFLGMLVVHAALLVFGKSAVRQWRSSLLALVAMLVACAPGFVHLYDVSRRQNLYSFREMPTLQELLLALFPPAILVFVVVAIVIAIVFQRVHFNRLPGRHLGMVLVWWMFPIVFFFAYSRVVGNSLFFWRFYSWSVPGFAILIGLLLRSLSPLSARQMACSAIVLLALLAPRHWIVEDWKAVSALIAAEEVTAPNQPLLLYSGLIELEYVPWLTDSGRKGFLTAPFAKYPISVEPVLLPSGFERPATMEYFDQKILPLLQQTNRVLLVSPHMFQFEDSKHKVPEYFIEKLKNLGFKAQALHQEGLVWVFRLERIGT